MKPTKENKIKALHDIWMFADIIKFWGGRESFYPLHYEMAEFNCLPQHSATTSLQLRRRLFLVPREHRKSTVNTVLYGMWRLYRNPNLRILIGTNVEGLGKSFITEIRAYFEDEELQETVWNNRPHIEGRMIPTLSKRENYNRRGRAKNSEEYDESEDIVGKVVWTNYKIQLVRTKKMKEASIEVRSVGQKATGYHYDICILDDIVDFTNSNTTTKAKKVSQFGNDLLNVVTKKAIWEQVSPGFSEWVGNEFVINGTRYEDYDYYSKYVGNTAEEEEARLEITGYRKFPKTSVWVNGVDNSDGYICPEIHDEEVDKDLRANLDHEKIYWAQYHNKIVPDSGEIAIQMEQFKWVDPRGYAHRLHNVAQYVDWGEQVNGIPARYDFPLIMVIDLAISQRSTADRFVAGVGGIDIKQRLHIPDIVSGRMRVAKQCQVVNEMAKQWGVFMVYVETGVGYQDAFIDALRDSFKEPGNIPLVIKQAPALRTNKLEAIEATLSPLLDNKLVYISNNAKKSSAVVSEIKDWRRTVTAKDDCLEVIHKIKLYSIPAVGKRGDGTSLSSARHLTVNKMYGGVR